MNYPIDVRKSFARPLFDLKVIAALLCAVSLLTVTPGSWAHTELEQSSPQNKAILKQAPPKVTLEFEEAVRLLNLKLSGPNKKVIDIGFSASTTENKTFGYSLPPLSDGKYAIEWSALGDDGHKVKGVIHFAIDPHSHSSMMNIPDDDEGEHHDHDDDDDDHDHDHAH